MKLPSFALFVLAAGSSCLAAASGGSTAVAVTSGQAECLAALSATRAQPLIAEAAELDGSKFRLVDNALIGDGSYLAVQEQTHIRNPRFSQLSVYEKIESPLTVLDTRDGSKLIDARGMVDLLNQNSPTPNTIKVSSVSTRRWLAGPTACWAIGGLSPSRPFIFDFASKTVLPMDDKAVTSIRSPVLDVTGQDRFLVVLEYSGAARGFAYVWDRVRNLGLAFKTAQERLEVRLSADGSRLIATYISRNEPSDLHQNAIIQLDAAAWKPVADVLDLDQMPVVRRFNGLILSHSADLKRILIDRTHGATNTGDPRSMLPELAIGELSRGSIFSLKPLDGWNRMQDALNQAKGDQTIIRSDGLSTEMSADGHHLLVNANFKTIRSGVRQGRRFTRQFSRNWLGRWDLEVNQLKNALTSTQLDSSDDVELTPSLALGEEKKTQAGRQLDAHLMPNGNVVVVRAVAHPVTGTIGSIVVKYKILADENETPLYGYRMDAVDFDAARLGDSVGVKALSVSPDGKVIVLGFASGAKILKVTDTTP